MFCIFQSLSSHINVFFYCASKSANGRPGNGFRNFYYRVEIARARYRKARLNDVDTEGFELLSYLYFFYCVELAAGHLFAIAQCCVEDIDVIFHCFSMYMYVKMKKSASRLRANSLTINYDALNINYSQDVVCELLQRFATFRFRVGLLALSPSQHDSRA